MAFDDTINRSAMIVWLFAASTSVATTRHLLDHEFHFPMHLLSLQLFCVVSFDFIRWLLYRSEGPVERPLLQWSAVLRRLPHAVCFSGALVCGYQAILHWHNLPIVVILLSLDWRATWTGARKASTGESIRQLATRISLLLFGIAFMLILDFRPSVVGITMLLLAVTFMAAAEFVESRKEESSIEGMYEVETSPPGTADFLGALLLALFWCHFREQQFLATRPYSPWASDLPILALNLICSTMAFNIGGHVFRYFPQSREQPTIRIALPILLVCLITVAHSWNSDSPSLIAPLQLIGFGAALMASLPMESQGECIDGCLDLENEAISTKSQGCRGEDTTRGVGSYLGREGLFLLLILFTSGAILGTKLAGRSVRSAPVAARLDGSFQPARPFDIVVARYDEPASEIAMHVNDLHSLSAVGSLQPRVFVYDKSEDSNSSRLLSELSRLAIAQSANIVHVHLDNIGRETDTYLEHITSNWDDLATHTLFIQASPHNPHAYLRRIRDYFVPETGFLSLADSGTFCSSCDECHDRDWSGNPSVTNAVFEDFNQGAACADVVLTYRGQFISSAARIRGNRLESYQRWLDELRSPESFLHTLPYTEDEFSRKQDFMSAPRSGFTFERMWGAMMQCNERRIATECPTLLRSAICPPAICGHAPLESCQCLDD